MNCRCPKCQTFFFARSAAFGTQQVCSVCGNQFELDSDHIASFQLPEAIHVRIVDKSGLPICLPNVIVLVSYGYGFPPLQTDDRGCLTLTAEMFLKAQSDEFLTGIMDHKGNYSLNRYITLRVPSALELQEMGKRRKQSHWPILPFEEEIYGDIDSICHAYSHNNNGSVCPTTAKVDLLDAESTPDVSLDVG